MTTQSMYDEDRQRRISANWGMIKIAATYARMGSRTDAKSPQPISGNTDQERTVAKRDRHDEQMPHQSAAPKSFNIVEAGCGPEALQGSAVPITVADSGASRQRRGSV